MTRTVRSVILAIAGLVTVTGPSFAEDSDAAAGASEYEISCAVCHGADGTGSGVMADMLVIKPADLTLIAKKNGGRFPFREVFQTIDGRAQIKGHGIQPMPIWGDRYTVDSGAAGVEPYKSWTAEPFVRARILELTYYLQSIQK